MRSNNSRSLTTRFFRRCPCLVLLVAASSAWAQVVPFTDRGLFTNAAPNAVNVINFEEFSGTNGFLPDFTELGFVTFHTNANYGQEVIDGGNVGAPGNKVYITVAADLGQTIADITFGLGVLAVGFDLKSTGNNATTGGQGFLARIFSGDTLIGASGITSPQSGTTFQFAGFTSTAPITRITFSSYELSPNQNIVLDNFLLSNELEFRITAIEAISNDVRITWNTIGGRTNFVQATAGAADGTYSNNFSDISGPIVVSGGQVSTNYVDIGGATNTPARYYRVRLAP
jgi:hypothetical protein